MEIVAKLFDANINYGFYDVFASDTVAIDVVG